MTGDRPSSAQAVERPKMGRDELHPAGPAEEVQTLPASVPQSSSGSAPSRRLLQRRLAQQTALAQFGQRALSATALEPLLAEATALVHRVFPAPASGAFELLLGDEDEVAFAESVADMLGVASGKLDAAEASRHAALHDPLTGLANRPLILDHLQLALARASRRSALAAVIFLDLDDFKLVNDTLGHAAGDELLVRIAERLRPAVRPADTLGRWGGDEFVVVCEDLELASEAPAIVQRLAAAFEMPFKVHDAELDVTASIGVAVSGGADDQPATLIHAADSAMYRAKRDHSAGGREGQGTPAKLERLTRRLLDLLAGSEVKGTPAAGQEAPASHAVS
jgi:diguanylate cyclase (GGDEF)-like protein